MSRLQSSHWILFEGLMMFLVREFIRSRGDLVRRFRCAFGVPFCREIIFGISWIKKRGTFDVKVNNVKLGFKN